MTPLDGNDLVPEAPPVGERAAFRWIPVRALAPRHRPRIASHLLALDAHDRTMRFGHAASDAQINRYVDRLDFDTDEIFGVFDRRLAVVGLAHLAHLESSGPAPRSAEFGVSVLRRVRGRGIGARLFDRAVLHARNRGVERLLIHSLSENAAMLHIVRRAGASVVHDGADVTSTLELPGDTLGTKLEALVEHRAAEWDYGLKLHAQRVDQFLRVMAGPQA